MVVPIFRVAKVDDVSALLALEAHYMAELEPKNFERWRAAKATHRKRIEMMLIRTFVAEMADEIVGYCYWGLHKEKAHIFNMYVHADFRRYGLAKCLLERTEEDILKKGFSLWTFCPLSTQPAKVFIEQLGYQLQRDDGEHMHMVKERAG
ncbi:GNAT family N-acetyltransferase [Pseudovibrio sp. Tun.PSC04-5.I4]|uniref:GNAT family N-acetyltransferase n=1 Tax=Pseudovibrio sp. Tun.PSC04-5.I4 TaxID=1798213 RepID=UPI00088B3F80|nr:GNAT family N-acetyltransferase [Pseudovibrio sp. Tun.PSC04-5.I4]SDR27373.1 Acetyltransferase (GNAT) domain-containing protein [Pseudovibrio sp. Tun.PSC04-5.I4]